MLRYVKSGMMLMSIAYIVLGLMLLIMPETSLLWICYAFGVVVLITGIVCLIQYARIRGTGFTAPFMLVGGVSPYVWFATHFIDAILIGPVFMLMVAKVQKRWSVTILGIIMGIIWFATGMHWAFSLGYIGMGIIADLVAGAGHYRNKAINLLSYMLMSLGGVYTYVVFFIDPQGWASTMLENGTEQSYIDTMSASAPSWLLAVIIIGTLAIAAFSGWIGGKLMKKQFEKAGITA